MANKLKKKEWTPHQLKRLPQEGYWLNIFKFSNDRISYTCYCIKNGYIRYIRDDFFVVSSSWSTLLWSCMTTRNQMNTLPVEEIGEYYHFESIEDLKDKFLNLSAAFYEKPDNDF